MTVIKRRFAIFELLFRLEKLADSSKNFGFYKHYCDGSLRLGQLILAQDLICVIAPRNSCSDGYLHIEDFFNQIFCVSRFHTGRVVHGQYFQTSILAQQKKQIDKASFFSILQKTINHIPGFECLL
ncbi:MAG: hypothetical protein PHW76_07515 [Alphaproteobacteria bacterium]|nr:hypothetical protein [Alphaproteobacteria bacterium]